MLYQALPSCIVLVNHYPPVFFDFVRLNRYIMYIEFLQCEIIYRVLNENERDTISGTYLPFQDP